MVERYPVAAGITAAEVPAQQDPSTLSAPAKRVRRGPVSQTICPLGYSGLDMLYGTNKLSSKVKDGQLTRTTLEARAHLRVSFHCLLPAIPLFNCYQQGLSTCSAEQDIKYYLK